MCLLAAALAFSPLPRLPLRRTALRSEVDSGARQAAKITLGTGTEYEVEKTQTTKRSKKSSNSESTASETTDSAPKKKKKKKISESTETTRVQKTSGPEILGITPKELWGPKGASLGFLCLVIYKRFTTGTWLAWGIQKWDDSSSRRTVVQSEDQLKKLNMLRCSKCGYTIFPALGRTFRYDRFVQGCPNCGAQEDPNDPLPLFYDRNDPDDPRNIKADGTNVVDNNREYMKKWILADKDTAKKITKTLAEQYKDKTDTLAKEGKLPSKLAQEMAEKNKEVKESSGDASSAEVWSESKPQGGDSSALRSESKAPAPTPKVPAPTPEEKETKEKKAPVPVPEEKETEEPKEETPSEPPRNKRSTPVKKEKKEEKGDIDDILGI